jgi:hypothetical protein
LCRSLRRSCCYGDQFIWSNKLIVRPGTPEGHSYVKKRCCRLEGSSIEQAELRAERYREESGRFIHTGAGMNKLKLDQCVGSTSGALSFP